MPHSLTKATRLPPEFAKRYHVWKSTEFADKAADFEHLATQGQSPSAMVISCCDSRVHVTSIFGAAQGDFFIHRNIANLVPPYQPDGQMHGTSAAIEFAVNHLKVSHILIVGHSLCGGVQGCFDMCSGNAPELEKETSFIGRWMDILRPGYAAIKDATGSDRERLEMLEKESVKLSLSNLLTFPFVERAVEADALALHGLWHDIGIGGLESYNPASQEFEPV